MKKVFWIHLNILHFFNSVSDARKRAIVSITKVLIARIHLHFDSSSRVICDCAKLQIGSYKDSERVFRKRYLQYIGKSLLSISIWWQNELLACWEREFVMLYHRRQWKMNEFQRWRVFLSGPSKKYSRPLLRFLIPPKDI